MDEQHSLMGGKVHLYKRDHSANWQCSAYLGGKNRRVSTKEDSLARAKDFAEDWYIELKGKYRAGTLFDGYTFKKAAQKFLAEYEVITEGERSPRSLKEHKGRIDFALLPFFGNKRLSEITPGLLQDYRVHRATSKKTGNKLSRSAMHKDFVTIRQVLKTALRHGWLDHMPDLSAPYKPSAKVSHRPWFSPDEYKALYKATRKRAAHPLKERWKGECQELHDYVLFMANTGLRPDEANRLEFRDVEIADDDSGRILEIEVRGKRGVGYCKSMPGAVYPFERMVKRRQPADTDKVFKSTHRELFNAILRETDLKKDRDGKLRTAYSLRHTYICMRLMEGADIYQIAKNCRTSVEMIEKYYAAHLKNTLDTAAINVRKSRPAKPKTGATVADDTPDDGEDPEAP